MQRRIALRLPLHYRSPEAQFVANYNFVDVRPTGLHDMWQWIKNRFGGKTPAAATDPGRNRRA